jgi:hypothetical protein
MLAPDYFAKVAAVSHGRAFGIGFITALGGSVSSSTILTQEQFGNAPEG